MGVTPSEPTAKEVYTAAARVIMDVLYAPRQARPELLRTVAYYDVRVEWRQPHGWAIFSACMSESDYAGCAQTQRFTTGAVAFLARKGSSTPWSFLAKSEKVVLQGPPRKQSS